MLACSPRSHEVTLRASAYALSRASRRRRTALLTAGLSKVMKINNICDSNHLKDCGISSKIITLKGVYNEQSGVPYPDI